jgi:formylglycine-generating enzyme required for sulfatase activity
MLQRKGTRQRFLREVQAAARLHHPNIVLAYAALQLGDLLVLAMEYVDGQDLAKLVKAQGKLPVPLACAFVRQAALGLQHAHEKGLVHRDIKPGNLMYTQQGKQWVIKILDFGLAKATSENPVDGSLTPEGQMLGTLDYIAPEQSFNAQNADIRADIYSLGCTLYHLLMGKPPFDGPGAGAILQAHCSIEAMPLNLARPEVPVELAAVVAQMMAKEPARRYQTPVEVAEALKPFCRQGQVGSRRSAGESSEPRRPESGAVDSAVVAPAPAPSPEPEPAGAAAGTVASAAVPPDDPALMWKSLIAIPEPEHLAELKTATPAPQWRWPPRAVLWGAAALVLLLAVIGLAAVVLKIPNKDGVLVLEGVPEQAEVLIDGKNVTVQWPGGGPLRVTVPTGKHGVLVKKEGFQAFGEDVSVETGGQTRLRVWLVTSIPQEPPLATITNSIGMKLVLIPAGEFLMGSPDSDKDAGADEKPRHRVRITRPLYLGATEVTVGQFRKVVEASGVRTEAEASGKGGSGWNEAKGRFEHGPTYTWRNPGFAQTDEHPVVIVSWNDAIGYCNQLSLKEGLTPFYRIVGARVEVPDWAATGYRLPTEAEWEYACRAGTTTRYESGDDRETLALVGNIPDGTFKAKYPTWPGPTIAARDGYVCTAPVGRFRPNAFGLYDMHGNVWEWCWDGFQADYYRGSPAADPLGPSQAAPRVIRGGSWDNWPRACRAAVRHRAAPGLRNCVVGFRLARGQSGP